MDDNNQNAEINSAVDPPSSPKTNTNDVISDRSSVFEDTSVSIPSSPELLQDNDLANDINPQFSSNSSINEDIDTNLTCLSPPKSQIRISSHETKSQKSQNSDQGSIRQLSSDDDEDLESDEFNLLKKSISNSSKSKNSPSTTTSKRKDSPESHSRRRSSSPDTDSQSTSNLRSRRKLRRRSKEPSEKSNRSNNHEILGSGYTSMPASGKVFRNLLILEESLREQVIQQRAMRRKYLTFLAILCTIIATLAHYLFISNSSPTQGATATRVILQFFLLATIVTLMLYHLSGEYQKTIVLPRKFLSSANKGLRQLNVRLVKIKIPFIDKFSDLIREASSYIIEVSLNIFHSVSPNSKGNKNSRIEIFLVKCKSQCQPRIGVTDVKLVLNARSFNTDIRESWEMYRSEFWINEGVRRRNNLLNFINEPLSGTTNKLVKRRKRKSSSIPSKLSEQNLQKLSNDFDTKASYSPSPSPLKSELEFK